MKRLVIPELLDTDSGTPEEIRDSLADLRWFNRYFGGLSTTQKLLVQISTRTGKTEISFLDVAGASADGALAAQEALAHKSVQLSVTVLDRSAAHIAPAQQRAGIAAVVGDAIQLPFADRSFDVVGSSLFVHHLEPPDIIQMMNEALRVCRDSVLINDLRRNRLHLATSIVGRPLYRSRITRHDAVASVRRAYTPEEMMAIIAKTNAGVVEYSPHYFYRMGFVIWRK